MDNKLKEKAIAYIDREMKDSGIDEFWMREHLIKFTESIIKDKSQLINKAKFSAIDEWKAAIKRAKKAEDALRFCNIELLDDGTIRYRPKAIKHHCGEIVAKKIIDQTIEMERLKKILNNYEEALIDYANRENWSTYIIGKDIRIIWEGDENEGCYLAQQALNSN